MSYARRGPESDVYVFATGEDGEERLICHGCSIAEQSHIEVDAGAMALHLVEHLRRGHKVPADALERLLVEAFEEYSK